MKKRTIPAFVLLIAVSSVFGQVSYHGISGWFHISEVSMSGGGSAIPAMTHSTVNPAAAAGLNRSVETAMVRYPAGIGAETFMLIIPAAHQTYGFEIRHTGYGIFKGYDEQGLVTEDYSANETWIIGTLAWNLKNERLKLGISGGVFRSQIQDYLSYAVTSSFGAIYLFPAYKISVSAGLKNSGRVMRTYSKADQQLPVTVFGGMSKKLKYLPLRAGLDVSKQEGWKNLLATLYLLIEASEEVSVMAGVSSNRIDQYTDFVFRNYISAASIGLSYASRGISVKSGVHFIGPGGLVVGVGVGMSF